MSLKSIIDSLPNGFHDSYLNEMKLDFSNKSLILSLDVWMDDGVNSENRFDENYRKGILILKGLKYIRFDNQCFSSFNFGELNSAWVEVGYDYSNISKPNDIIATDNSGWIFFNDLSAFVHVHCSDSSFTWI